MKTVLHVLPHPGGGGERYVDSLSDLPDYRSDRVYLASSPSAGAALRTLPRRWLDAQLAARRHDLVHLHGEVASTICLPSLALRPSVVTLHGLNLVRRLDGLPRRAAEMNLQLIVKAAKRTICVSEAERADVFRAIGARLKDRVILIHNGVDPTDRPTHE